MYFLVCLEVQVVYWGIALAIDIKEFSNVLKTFYTQPGLKKACKDS